MARSKSSKRQGSALPKPPIVFINDSTGGHQSVPQKLAGLVPQPAIYSGLTERGKPRYNAGATPDPTAGLSELPIITNYLGDVHRAAEAATSFWADAVKNGQNFISINLTERKAEEKSATKPDWGTNHLEFEMAGLTTDEAAEKIFKWLFTVFTVPEMLYLIPESDMRVTDDQCFPDYAYCAISDSHKQPKDAKIQFVALIASKPQVGKDQRLHWKVVDRTGEANFFFQYRNASSKTTWDWVLALQPGDRKALPRMPMVHVPERKLVTVTKAPFRGVGLLMGGAGYLVKGVGKGLCRVGDKVGMGKSGGKWVPEADWIDEQVQKVNKANVVKKEIKIFDEKGARLWRGDEDCHSVTSAGSICDEKAVKEFC